MGALEKPAERAQELDHQWRSCLEAARYEAEKAARRYHRVEPENRLVARTLEPEWNARLLDLERLEKEHAEVRSKPPFELAAAQRERMYALAHDVPRLWRAPPARPSQRKEVLRLLIDDVALVNADEPWGVTVTVRWRTGASTRHRAGRVLPHPQTTAQEVLARIEALYTTQTDRESAARLNAECHRSGYGKPSTGGMATHLRGRRALKKYRLVLTKPGPTVH